MPWISGFLPVAKILIQNHNGLSYLHWYKSDTMIKVSKYTEVHFLKCIIFPYKSFLFFSCSLQSPKLFTTAFHLPAHSTVYVIERSHVHRGPQGQGCNTLLDNLNSYGFPTLSVWDSVKSLQNILRPRVWVLMFVQPFLIIHIHSLWVLWHTSTPTNTPQK